ncbi:nucleotide disphospho-sugar-binding domain-containing protein [Nocardiopsis flavescens]|uniref:nucleotide disphospho-sugar-binding domain-containing protein n=1 Tax=Nocardiopsis flavescens TaxID=758803 RepID=UPI0036531F2D
MRILIAAQGERTHFLGMVPLAWALRAAGHEVLVAGQPALMGAVAASGLPGAVVGPDFRLGRMLDRRGSDGAELDLTACDFGGDPGETLRGYARLVTWWLRVVNEPMFASSVALYRRWRPDLVLWEPTALAAPVAAEAVGAVHARILWSLDFLGRSRDAYLRAMAAWPPAARRDPLAEWLDGHAARWGVEFRERMTRGYFTLDYLPEPLRLQDAPGVRYVPLRYIPYNGRAVVPDWLLTPPERPRVCLTLGTSATERYGGFTLPLREVLTALGDLDAEIVATLPAAERGRLGALPPNVRPVGFTPLDPLARTCSAFVDQGGSGTFLTALTAGVPQLVVPHARMYDSGPLAERFAAQGAGLHLAPGEVTGEAVRDAVDLLLRDPSYTGAGLRLREGMEAAPSPGEVARDIGSLVSAHAG